MGEKYTSDNGFLHSSDERNNKERILSSREKVKQVRIVIAEAGIIAR